MAQVNASRRKEVVHTNMWNRIHSNYFFLCRHCIYHYPVYTGGKWFIHTGTAVEEHIQNFRCRLIGVFRLDNTVAALCKIGPGILFSRLKHPVNFGVIIAFIPSGSFVLKNQKEAPCERLPASNVFDKSDIILSHFPALGIFLLLQLLPYHGNMLVRIRFAGNGFELQAHRGYFQPAGKAGNNIKLLLIGAQCEVDRFYLQNPDITSVGRLNDSVPQILNRKVVLYKFKLFVFSFFSF